MHVGGDQPDRDVLQLDALQAVGVVQRNEHRVLRRSGATLAVLPGNPEHVGFPLSLTRAGGDEEEIRDAVDVVERFGG